MITEDELELFIDYLIEGGTHCPLFGVKNGNNNKSIDAGAR